MPFQQIQDGNGNIVTKAIWDVNNFKRSVFAQQIENDIRLLEKFRDTSGSIERDSIKSSLSPHVDAFIDFKQMEAGFDAANAQIDNYRSKMKAASKANFSFAAGLGKIGKSLATMGLEAIISILVTKGIEALYNWYDQTKNASKYAIEDAEEMEAAWEKIAESQKEAEQVVKDYGEECLMEVLYSS